MIVNREREKLLNAIVFFCKETKHCHTLKLFKLLNFMDFEHFRQAGRTVTGLDYKAWERGPVPSSLWHEIQNDRPADLSAFVTIIDQKDELTGELMRRDLKAKKTFDPKLFTRRELAIMKTVAEIFRDARGETMTDFSHFKGLPWKAVWNGGKGKGKLIPAELSLKSEALEKHQPTIDSDEVALRMDLRRGLA